MAPHLTHPELSAFAKQVAQADRDHVDGFVARRTAWFGATPAATPAGG
jgi:hypothetical protein